MQISIYKYFILVVLLLLSSTLVAQVAKRKYITRSGDTTVVVMAGSTGLHGDDARFLLDEKAPDDLKDKRSRFSKLRDAIQATGKVASVVEEEYRESTPSAGTLDFRTAQEQLRILRSEREAEDQSRKAAATINTDMSVAEMAYIKKKFGDRPSYFINGVAVEPAMASKVNKKDILSSERKSANTATGNPNGEVWMIITSRAFDRLGLDRLYADKDEKDDDIDVVKERPASKKDKYDFREVPSPAKSVTTTPKVQEKPVVSPERQQKLSQQQREIEELRKAIESYGVKPVVDSPQKNQQVSSTSSAKSREETAEPVKGTVDKPRDRGAIPYEEIRRQPEKQAESDTETRVIMRQNGNRLIDSEEEIVSFKDSPQERSRRARDKEESKTSVSSEREAKEEVIQVKNQVEDTKIVDPDITKETPKRSVRRIKERQRHQ